MHIAIDYLTKPSSSLYTWKGVSAWLISCLVCILDKKFISWSGQVRIRNRLYKPQYDVTWLSDNPDWNLFTPIATMDGQNDFYGKNIICSDIGIECCPFPLPADSVWYWNNNYGVLEGRDLFWRGKPAGGIDTSSLSKGSSPVHTVISRACQRLQSCTLNVLLVKHSNSHFISCKYLHSEILQKDHVGLD